MSRRVSREIIGKARWLQLAQLQYRDIRTNEVRTWESTERVSTSTTVDAVEIAALITTPEDAEGRLILVQQYRAPIDKLSIEFPAGLVDGDEGIEVAALRELKEETGFIGEVLSCSPSLSYEPGLTSSAFSFVRVFVDGSKEVNQNPKPQLEEDEDIKVLLLPRVGLLAALQALAREGNQIDGKVWAYAAGIDGILRGGN